MDPLTKKAVIFLIVFVILSVAQRLTGIGSQPQLSCQFRNTFQMKTSVKRLGGADGSTLTPPSFGFGTLDKMLRKLCRKDDDTGVNRFGMLASPLKSLFALRKSKNSTTTTSSSSSAAVAASESPESPGAGHRTSFEAYDDE